MMPTPAHILLATIAVAIIAIILIIRGWRGRRIDDHPLCRKCGYDLHGIESPQRCPECGRDLARRRSIRTGHRRKRKPSLAIGLVLLLAALGSGGMIGWAAARDVNWTPLKPLWLLRVEAARGDPKIAGIAVQEITERFNDGRMSQGQFNSIADEALAAQVDLSKSWHVWWGEMIELAATSRRIDDDRLKRYIINAVKPHVSLEASKQVNENGMIDVAVVLAPFRAGKYPNVFSVEVARMRIMLGDRDTFNTARSILAIDAGGMAKINQRFRIDLPPGEHRVRVEMRLRSGFAMNLASAKEDIDGTLISGWELAEDLYELTSDFEVVASGAAINND